MRAEREAVRPGLVRFRQHVRGAGAGVFVRAQGVRVSGALVMLVGKVVSYSNICHYDTTRRPFLARAQGVRVLSVASRSEEMSFAVLMLPLTGKCCR